MADFMYVKDAAKLLQSASSFDTVGENFYHGFILGLCAMLSGSYTTSNRESGEGRYGIQMLPRDLKLPGILIELKWEKDCAEDDLKKLSETALKQINDKKYDTEMLSKGVMTIYKYGVAFSGKNVVVTVLDSMEQEKRLIRPEQVAEAAKRTENEDADPADLPC